MLSLTLCTGLAEGPERIAREVASSFGLNLEGTCLPTELSEKTHGSIGSITPFVDFGMLRKKMMDNITNSQGLIIFRPPHVRDPFVDMAIMFAMTKPRQTFFRPCLMIVDAVSETTTQENIEIDARRFAKFIIDHKLSKINITGSVFNVQTDVTSTLDIFTSFDGEKRFVHAVSDDYCARIRIFLRAAFTELSTQMILHEPLASYSPFELGLGGCQCKQPPPLVPIDRYVRHRRPLQPIPFPLLKDDNFETEETVRSFDPSDYLNFPLE